MVKIKKRYLLIAIVTVVAMICSGLSLILSVNTNGSSSSNVNVIVKATVNPDDPNAPWNDYDWPESTDTVVAGGVTFRYKITDSTNHEVALYKDADRSLDNWVLSELTGENLTLNIPSQVTLTGANAGTYTVRGLCYQGFREITNQNVKTVVIPSTLKWIEGNCFWGSEYIQTIIYDTGCRLDYHGVYPYFDTGLISITFPEAIGYYDMMGDTYILEWTSGAITNLVIPGGVGDYDDTFWDNLFGYDTSTYDYACPSLITKENGYCYYGITDNSHFAVKYDEDFVGERASTFHSDVKVIVGSVFENSVSSVVIPQGVECLVHAGFGRGFSDSVTSVEFPASIKCVGPCAFIGCTALTNVTFKGEIPPDLGENVFTIFNTSTYEYEVIDGLTITVPAGKKSVYTAKSANWLALAGMIEEVKAPETGIVADLSLTIGAVVLLGAVLVVLKNKMKEQL